MASNNLIEGIQVCVCLRSHTCVHMHARTCMDPVSKPPSLLKMPLQLLFWSI